MVERQVRNTVSECNATEIDQIMQDIIEQLRKKEPTCEKVLQVAEKETSIADRPQLAQIFRDRPDQLKKLVSYCLQPQKLSCKNTSYPYLARNILRVQPPILLLSLIDPPTIDGRCLFQFLKANPNETARGYFYDLLNIFSNNFQKKIRAFLMYDKVSLDLCLNRCYYSEVFNALFNIIIYATDGDGQFQGDLLNKLLSCVSGKTQPVMISENILATLSEAHENISRLNPIVCRIIINTLNAAFIERVIDMIMDSYHEHEEHCQNLLQILTVITRIYQYFFNANNKNNAGRDISPLQEAIVKLIQSISKIGLILKDSFSKEINFSNGQNVTTIGLVRYYALELIQKLMELPADFVSKNFDMNKGELLHDLQDYITTNPWNNMVHRFVEKIVISIINSFENYKDIEDNYIGKEGFLGFLIETFKNHDYVFLNSEKLSTYGYVHCLYNIAQAICIKLQKSQDLRTVMQKFQPWGEFVFNDLQKYEQTLELNLGGEQPNQIIKKKQNKQDSIRKIVVDMSQKQISITAEQNEDFNEHFYEVVVYSQGFKKGRSTVRKNSYSVDSPVRGTKVAQTLSERNLSHGMGSQPSKSNSRTPACTPPLVSPASDIHAGLLFATYPIGKFVNENDSNPVNHMHRSQFLQALEKQNTEKDMTRSHHSKSFSQDKFPKEI